MEASFNGIEPIYPANKTISSKVMQKLVLNALNSVTLAETLPSDIRERNNLCDINKALWDIHFPKTKESFERAKKRLVFEELFILQLSLSIIKRKAHTLSGFIIKNKTTGKLNFSISQHLITNLKILYITLIIAYAIFISRAVFV